MRTIPTLPVLLLLAAFPAQAEIWECTDAAGNRRFTNIQAESKGCKLLNITPPNVVSAPPGKPKAGGKTPRPADFPTVDNNTQRQRDSERRRILEQELASEQKLLEQARRDLAEQESIRLGSERNYQRVLDRLEPYRNKVKLHEDNIANLNRELASTK